MGKPHEQRRHEIIQAALALAAEQGVKKVTTQAIADRVGIAQPTVFRHFKTRDEIFAGAISWLANQLFLMLDTTLDDEMTPDRRLERLLRTQLRFVSRHKGLPRMLFSDRLHMESPVLKQVVQKVLGRYTQRVAAVIQDGVESGCFHHSQDPEQSARHVAALVQGTIVRWSIFDFGFSLEEEAEDLWNFIQAALRTGAATPENR